MNICVVEAGRAFNGMMFRTALQSGWYALLNARDAYRLATGEQGMRKDLVLRFIDVRLKSIIQYRSKFQSPELLSHKNP